MRKHLKLFARLLAVVCICSFTPATTDCGVYRWDYKILIDDLGLSLLNKHAEPETLASLVNIERPATLGNQRTEPEQRKVTITAWVIMLGKEDDGDYHLVLANNDHSKTMVAEIPDPGCSKLQGFPELKRKYGLARTFINDHIKTPGNSVASLEEPVKISITGFLFFDKIAHGNGHSPNGIEIHPVLSVK